jgi:hypothetical protein
MRRNGNTAFDLLGRRHPAPLGNEIAQAWFNYEGQKWPEHPRVSIRILKKETENERRTMDSRKFNAILLAGWLACLPRCEEMKEVYF